MAGFCLGSYHKSNGCKTYTCGQTIKVVYLWRQHRVKSGNVLWKKATPFQSYTMEVSWLGTRNMRILQDSLWAKYMW